MCTTWEHLQIPPVSLSWLLQNVHSVNIC
uniref:Uncharacterized protein n=1 Tax=Anguilla anguilla TaxID=7936 RepID=A0A0E9VU32_ANGAN